MRRIVLIGGGALILAAGAAAFAAPESRLSRLSVAETELSAEQSQNMHRLARLLSVLAQFRRDPPPALIASPDDARDAVRAAILVKAMTPELAARAQAYARGASEIMRQRRLAVVQSEALFTRDSLAADAAPEPTGGAQIGPDAAPITPPVQLVWPVSTTVARAFGAPLEGGGEAAGLTFAPTPAARVVSPGDGVVQYVGEVRGWGLILILRLTGGYHLVLAGLGKSDVAVGQSVAPGQPVGSMPDDRQSSSELYLEVRERGAPVDPARWLRRSAG